MPERNVLPKPVQKPHPPMWVTVTSPGTELDAAERGLGCLGVAAAGYDEQERRTEEYFRRIESCDPVGGDRDQRGDDAQLPVLPRRPRDRGREAGHGNGRRVRPRQLASHVDARGVSHSGVPVARQPRATGRCGRSRAVRATRTASPKASASATPTSSAPRSSGGSRSASTGINFLLNGLETIPQQQVLDSMRLFAARSCRSSQVALMLDRHRTGRRVPRPRRDDVRLRHRSGDAARCGDLPGDVRDAHRRTASRRSRRACIPRIRRRSSRKSGAAPTVRGVRSRSRRRGSGARSGLRPRGFVQGCVCDNDAAPPRCARRWGFPVQPGASRCASTTTRWKRSRRVDGHVVLVDARARIRSRSGTATSRTRRRSRSRTRRAACGWCRSSTTSRSRVPNVCVPSWTSSTPPASACTPRVEPYHPVSASIALGTIELHRLRFVCRPDELAFTGTEPIDA